MPLPLGAPATAARLPSQGAIWVLKSNFEQLGSWVIVEVSHWRRSSVVFGSKLTWSVMPGNLRMNSSAPIFCDADGSRSMDAKATVVSGSAAVTGSPLLLRNWMTAQAAPPTSTAMRPAPMPPTSQSVRRDLGCVGGSSTSTIWENIGGWSP